MLVVRETLSNSFTEIPFGSSIQVGDVLHPWQITELWSDTDLAQLKVYRVAPATVPAGQMMTGYTFARNASGVVEQVPTLVDLPPVTPVPPQPPVTVFPLSVTPRQIRLALTQMGLRQAVEDFVSSQDITVKDSWEYSTQFERNHPLLLGAAQALNKTEADIDALFELARSIS